MKLMNFKTYEDRKSLTPAQMDLAVTTEFNAINLGDANEGDEVYVFMVNPKFLVEYQSEYGIQSYITCRTICIFREKGLLPEYYGKKHWTAMYMDDNQMLKPHSAGNLGQSIVFGGLFGINEDLDTLMKEANACYGARNIDELNNIKCNFGKTFQILEQGKKAFQIHDKK